MNSNLSLDISEDDNVHSTKFGNIIERIGKTFSFTFWRTQVGNEVFWSVQGSNTGSGTWITTAYLGPPEMAKRFQQEVILVHPTERKIKMSYLSTCEEGQNHIYISKNMLQHFNSKGNSFEFEFRIIKMKRRPYPRRMM